MPKPVPSHVEKGGVGELGKKSLAQLSQMTEFVKGSFPRVIGRVSIERNILLLDYKTAMRENIATLSYWGKILRKVTFLNTLVFTV